MQDQPALNKRLLVISPEPQLVLSLQDTIESAVPVLYPYIISTPDETLDIRSAKLSQPDLLVVHLASLQSANSSLASRIQNALGRRIPVLIIPGLSVEREDGELPANFEKTEPGNVPATTPPDSFLLPESFHYLLQQPGVTLLPTPLPPSDLLEKIAALLQPAATGPDAEQGGALLSATVLLCDDDPDVVRILSLKLKRMGCRVVVAATGAEGLQITRSQQLDLLLTDYDMPVMSGLELARKVRQEFPELPVILITGAGSERVAADALMLGVSRYLIKPFTLQELDQAIREVLSRHKRLRQREEPIQGSERVSHQGLAKTSVQVEEQHKPAHFSTHLLPQASRSAQASRQRSHPVTQLQLAFQDILQKMVETLEMRNQFTAGHTKRVTRYALAMAAQLRWDDQRRHDTELGCLLHDIGKIGVPDTVLLREGRLDEPEFALMRQHPALGVHIIAGSPDFEAAVPYILYHHERYDGKGYPEGLAGEAIPIEGRLLAVADTFDAMTAPRASGQSSTGADAQREIERLSGTQFDPEMVAAFIAGRVAGTIRTDQEL